MKRQLVICSLALIMAWTAHGGIIYNPANNINANIPDGSPSGWAGTATASGYLPSLSDISVTLNISGGYNGDLYAGLSYGGVLVPLLNRVGVSSGNPFGSDGAGMSVTLSDSGSVNIHAAGDGVLGGTYRADGQNIDPLSSASSFSATGGSIMLDAVGTGFGNMNPNGTWTLFLADLSGGGQSTLVSWSLEITAVPEPVNVALGIFAGVFVVVVVVRSRSVRNRVQRWREAFVVWVNAV